MFQFFLRQKLGLSEDEIIGVQTIITKQQKQKKALQHLFKTNTNLEEQIIALKMKNKELNKIISDLSDRVCTVCGDSLVLDNAFKKDATSENIDEVDGNRYKEIVEENDALRKGLHEILDKLHAKDGIFNFFVIAIIN